LLREAIELMLSGDEKTGRAILRNYINRKTAVDPRHGRQVRDLSGVSTAAQFTQWVTTAFAANTCG
jgi:hypothetical protein